MNLNNLTDEQIRQLAIEYHQGIKVLDMLANQMYETIHHEACKAKGVLVTPCNFMLLKKENNPLNQDEEAIKAGGTCLGMYLDDVKRIAINVAGIMQMVIKQTQECDMELAGLLMVDTIAHEITHYLQDMNGETFDMITSYYERAHEKEARAVGQHVATKLRQYIKTAVKYYATLVA